MKSLGIKSFILTLALVFLGDAINCDILIADGANALFHTNWNAISREVVKGKAGASFDHSPRSIAASMYMAQDEDSPTTLDTAFPHVESVIPMPEPPVIATCSGTVHHTYISLCTLLL